MQKRPTQLGLYWRAQQNKGSFAKEPYKTMTLVQKRPTQLELYWKAHSTKALLQKIPSIQVSPHLGASPNQNDYSTILLISNHVETLESLPRNYAARSQRGKNRWFDINVIVSITLMSNYYRLRWCRTITDYVDVESLPFRFSPLWERAASVRGMARLTKSSHE